MQLIYNIENAGMGVLLVHFEAMMGDKNLDCTIKAADVEGKLRISTGTLEARTGVNKDTPVSLSNTQYRALLDDVLEDISHYRKNF